MHSFKFLKKVSVVFCVCVIFISFIYYFKKETSDPKTVTVFFRWNQLSNSPASFLKPIILVASNLKISDVELLDKKKNILTNLSATKITDYNSAYSAYDVELPPLGKGIYYLKTLGQISPAYVIDDFSHAEILSKSLSFFKIQRCGSPTTAAHVSCHKENIQLTDDLSGAPLPMDLSGGWHDAGDYLRFVFTTSYTTFMLLSAAEELNEQDPLRQQLLDEAEWGLVWLKKMLMSSSSEFYQIGDVSDHSSWRLPESDTRDDYKVKVYSIENGSGANLLGRTIASMALYARLISAKDKTKADDWKQAALHLFEQIPNKKKSQKTTDNFYNETLWQDDMALAALALFELTQDARYLADARKHIQAMSDIWYFSYDQLQVLAYYRWAKTDPEIKHKVIQRLETILYKYQEWSHKNTFSQAMDNLYWGSQAQILGAGITALIYQRLSHKNTFQKLALAQWDYTLGKNPWGKSFVSGIGTNWLKKPHHQISQIKSVELLGYWAPGAVTKKNWLAQNIKLAEIDALQSFQSDGAVVFDDRQDYVTNEPTISIAATGILFTTLMQSIF